MNTHLKNPIVNKKKTMPTFLYRMVKKLIPNGRITCKGFIEPPVTKLKFSIKKSLYLKHPKRATLQATPKIRRVFLPIFIFVYSSPKALPTV